MTSPLGLSMRKAIIWRFHLRQYLRLITESRCSEGHREFSSWKSSLETWLETGENPARGEEAELGESRSYPELITGDWGGGGE